MECCSFKQWAYLVMQRDGMCFVCGIKTDLHAHRVKCKNRFPKIKLDLSNGIAMCNSCHGKYHCYVFADNISMESLRMFKAMAIYTMNKSKIRKIRSKRSNKIFIINALNETKKKIISINCNITKRSYLTKDLPCSDNSNLEVTKLD